MAEPCKDCNEEENLTFREGKVKLRFIRAKKKPKGALRNFKDGQEYWMYPRWAKMPWWEPVDKIDFPVVEPATEKESALEFENLDNIEKTAYLGESGISSKPGVGLVGQFNEPLAPAQIIPPDPLIPEKEEPADFTEPCPSDEWTKKELLDFITSKGGVGKLEMRKTWLLEIALNLA